MDSQLDTTVDISDSADICKKLPSIRALYEEKRQQLTILEQEAEYWRQLVRNLSAIAGEPGSLAALVPAPSGRAPAQDTAVAALASYERPAGPARLYRYMVSQGIPAKNANQVGASLWAACKAGRLVKTPEGLYALPG
jgi:hypothetical protein